MALCNIFARINIQIKIIRSLCKFTLMKLIPCIFISLLLTFCKNNPLHAQVIGANAEGLTFAGSEEDIPYLLELTRLHPVAIRWPGGGDTKLAFPSLDKPGLGLNADSIYKLYHEFTDSKGKVKNDKLAKDLKQAENDSKEPRSALLDLIELSKKINIQVDYCLNVMQGTSESNISAIRTLIDSGVNVISIVAGNETFYSYQYDFEAYQSDFEPILKACEKQFPSIPRFLCVGQEIHRKQHIEWNRELFNYIHATGDFISGVDVHYYLMEELKEAASLHPKMVVYKADSSYRSLDAAFEKYIELTRNDTEMDNLLNYFKANIPGKIYHCTEFGDKQAEYWSNTIANGGHLFMVFCKYRNDFQILLVHNFIANWYWAARRPVGKLDYNPENKEKLNRCSWYSMQLANELPYETPALQKITEIAEQGTYYFYFNNSGGKGFKPEIKFRNCKLISFEVHYVTGKHAYSSAGQTGFMDKRSDKNFEVKGIDIVQSEEIEDIPYNSYGYVRVVVE